jgi:hypothetical protein
MNVGSCKLLIFLSGLPVFCGSVLDSRFVDWFLCSMDFVVFQKPGDVIRGLLYIWQVDSVFSFFFGTPLDGYRVCYSVYIL